MPLAQPLATKEPYGCGCSCCGAQNLFAALTAASNFDRCHSFLLALSATDGARKRPPCGYIGPCKALQRPPRARPSITYPFLSLRGGRSPTRQSVLLCNVFKAAPHNSARAFGERFFVGPRFEKRRNTLCISNFSNRWIGEKYPAKAEGAIMRCCLKRKPVQRDADCHGLLRKPRNDMRGSFLTV